MKLADIITALDLTVLSCPDVATRDVCGGYAGDLLSDVMAHSHAGQLWITRQTHRNVIAVAALKEHSGVILAQAARPDPEMLAKAAQENILVAVSPQPAFETAGLLYRLLASATAG